MNRRELIGVLCGAAPAGAAVVTHSAARKPVVVESPDRSIRVEFGLFPHAGQQAVACYSVFFRSKPLIQRASLGVQLDGTGWLGSDLKIAGVTLRQNDTTYEIRPGKTSSARDHYSEAVVSLQETGGPQRKFELIFRAYDDGAALRYRFPEQPALAELTLAAEHTTFSFVGSPLAYTLPVSSFTTPYEVYYRPMPLESVATDPLIALPLLLEYPGGVCAAIAEADLTNYAGMYLSGSVDAKGALISGLSPLPEDLQIKVRAKLPHQSPWRVVMIADDPGRLIESNLITNLNPPCALADTRWRRADRRSSR